MRVLIFSTAYFPFVGGAEVAIKEITERLKDYEFVMITAKLRSDLPAVEKVDNIDVHRIGKGNHWDKYRLIWQGPRYAQKFGHFDAIWGVMASYAGFAALRYKKGKNTPFLLTLQEGDSKPHIYKHIWWCWPYFKQIFKKADYIQAISTYLADWAKEMGAKCPVEVVPNGVDIEKFKVQSSKFKVKDEMVKQLKLPNDAKSVITISRLVKKNGVGDLIKAMKFLDKNVHLLIIGDGELKSKLVLLVKRLGLVGRVYFLDNVSHNDLPKYLWASDVFCRPSLSEGLGNVFLEAMAAGLPVVGTNVGGIPDFLKNGETGLFCEVGSSKDIAEKIKKVLENIDLKVELIENGRKLVEERYDWNLIADKMRKIFDNICVY